MRRRYVKGWFGAAVVAVGAFSAPAQAQQVPISPTSVIGGSGSWSANPYDSGQFNATLVADFQGATTGINEPDQNPGDADGGFWLGKEGGVVEDFVLDLGAQTQLGSVNLFNTHNGNFNDRATGAFEIFGSNTVEARPTTETGAGGVDLVTPVSVGSGTLAFQPRENDPIEPQTFPLTGNFRYLRFNTLGPAVGVPNVGLNEIQVFQVPEPAALTLLGAAGLLALRRRRRTS